MGVTATAQHAPSRGHTSTKLLTKYMVVKCATICWNLVHLIHGTTYVIYINVLYYNKWENTLSDVDGTVIHRR